MRNAGLEEAEAGIKIAGRNIHNIRYADVTTLMAESITTNKASGGDRIPVELFQILKDDAVKVLHSICQQIWKTQQCPQDWKKSVFIPITKKAMPKNAQVQFSSVAQSCPTLCKPMNRSTPGLPVH